MISKASLISFRNLDLAWSRITTAKNLQHKRMFRHLYSAYEPGRKANLLEDIFRRQAATHNLGLRNVEWACLGASESNFAGDGKRFFQAYPATPQSHGGRVPEVPVPSGGSIPHYLTGVRLLRTAD
jgi:hypothetical protein